MAVFARFGVSTVIPGGLRLGQIDMCFLFSVGVLGTLLHSFSSGPDCHHSFFFFILQLHSDDAGQTDTEDGMYGVGFLKVGNAPQKRYQVLDAVAESRAEQSRANACLYMSRHS